MSKFILIDHSIKGFGGHHYEYAIHVLQAAKDKGYEPVLVVNKDFSADTSDAPWRVIPAYRYGFWQTSASGAPLTHGRIRDWIFPLRNRVKYSWFGSTWHYLLSLLHHHTAGTLIETTPGKFRLLAALVLLVVVKYPVLIFRALQRVVLTILEPLNNWLANLRDALLHLGRELLFPFRVFLHLGKLRSRMQNMGVQRAFGEDTRTAFQQTPLQDGDVVFIPTLSERDMLGLLDYLRACPESKRASWHLLFRRNIYQGTEFGYAQQNQSLQQLAGCFRAFQAGLDGHTVQFYTDTDRLTDQYNRLGAGQFTTLPIPVNPRLHQHAKEASRNGRLKVVYAGDARQEKGYHYLPQIVSTLLQNDAVRDLVEFEFQSNFNHARPEDGTEELLSRSELQQMPADRVKLHMQPMSSEDYFDLVSSADILLILYDHLNYYARSSGILIEALIAGIPVVTSAASWMGEILAEPNHCHAMEAIDQATVVKRLPTDDLKWVSNHNQSAVAESGTISFRGGRDKISTYVQIPNEADYMVLVYDRPRSGSGHVMAWASQCVPRIPGRKPSEDDRVDPASHLKPRSGQCDCDDVASTGRLIVPSLHCEKCAMIVRIHPEAKLLWLALWNGLTDVESIALSNLELVFLKDPAGGIQEEVVGTTYTEPSHIPFQLQRLVLDYPRYKQSAMRFAEQMHARHSAERLVEELVS